MASLGAIFSSCVASDTAISYADWLAPRCVLSHSSCHENRGLGVSIPSGESRYSVLRFRAGKSAVAFAERCATARRRTRRLISLT